MIDIKEIEEVRFDTALRGYSKKDVDNFLDELCERVSDENKKFEELERKYAAIKIQIEDIKTTAEEEHAECEKLRAQAVEELERARNEAEAIIAYVREEEKQCARRSKFEAEKALAAAKREAMLITDEAKQKATAVELASHRAADRVIAEAKKNASSIVRGAKEMSEELIINAQASVEGERRLFMKMREEIISRSGELSKLLTGQLSDIARFADRVRKVNFGEILSDRDELLGKLAEEVADKPVQESETAKEVSAEVTKEVLTEEVQSEAPEAPEVPEAPETPETPKEEVVGEESAEDVEELILDEVEEESAPMEDDDTYDFAGYADKGNNGGYVSDEVPTAEYDGLPHTGMEKAHKSAGGTLSDEEINRIFSFDVEEILGGDDSP